MQRTYTPRSPVALRGDREGSTGLGRVVSQGGRSLLGAAILFAGSSHTIANLTESRSVDLTKVSPTQLPKGVHISAEETGLRVRVETTSWQTFDLIDSTEDPHDFSGSSELELSIRNHLETPTQFTLILETPVGPNGKTEQACFMIRLFPGENYPVRLPIFHLLYSYSGWDWPLPWSKFLVCSWGKMDITHTAKIKVRMRENADFEIQTIRRSGPAPSTQWADAFGQRAEMTWPQKIYSEEELKQADERERRLKVRPWTDRDSYGAWKGGPRRQATGFFRLEQIADRWWFIAPNGNLFFSAGVNCVVHGIETPMLEEKIRDAYVEIPSERGPFAEAWGERDGIPNLSFHRVNMIRKWGAEAWKEEANILALARLNRWGFNTLGNWSNPALRGKKPWVSLGPNDFSPVVRPMAVPLVGHKLQDPYHPEFLTEAARIAESSVAPYRDDPWLLGHFVGNEVGWSDFFPNMLLLPEDQPAKVELVKDLKQKYGDITKLNAAWGSNAASFQDLRWPGEFDPQFSPQAHADLREFRGKFADLWYSLWTQVVREADPNHLILGSRFHGNERYEEVLIAAGKYCDVLSFNEYSLLPDPAKFASYYQLTKRPFLIGEFGHNSLDTGNLTCAAPVQTQEDRGKGYKIYMETLASQPWFVGAHFFQYYDEPITGRPDSETAYNGLVAVTDIPWTPLATAAIETNRRIYRIHAGQERPTTILPNR